jgi:hypothetical protein
MPHFKIMDEDSIDHPEGAFLRAKLHYRSAIDRIERNIQEEAIPIMYDSIEYTLKSKLLTDENKERVSNIDNIVDLINEFQEFRFLKTKVQKIQSYLDHLMEQGRINIDLNLFKKESNEILQAIGLIPFDLSELPPEYPGDC